MNKTNFTVANDKKTLLMERAFNAPKSMVWKSFTTAEALEKWWGPTGWETEVKKLDFSVGGEWIYVMTCVDKDQEEWFGKTSAGKTVFSNISPEDSMEYVDYFTDENGNINDDMPSSRTVLTLDENEDGSTTLKTKTTYETAEALTQVLEMGMEEGYSQTMDKLEEFVTS